MQTTIRFLAALTLPVLASVDACANADDATKPNPSRLVVQIVVDQLRADYLTRWKDQFGPGGFRRLTTEGAWFQNCRYPYASTMTGPGHASMSTGCSPDVHGVVMNEWFERASGREVNCVDSDRYERVPPRKASSKGGLKRAGGASPERLLAPTIADELKASNAKSKVVSVSFKDRSAILPAGRKADGVYWFDFGVGAVTSRFYSDRLPAWVEDFNRSGALESWFGRPWDRFRKDVDYAKLSGPDDVPGEGEGTGQHRTFPHPGNGGSTKPDAKYGEALYNSPYGNDLLLEFALGRAIEGERLGRRDAVDLLCISFSSTDVVGHCWGPDSQEVLDCTLRMDADLARLLDRLDDYVGKGKYTVVLSADHGVCPLPEVSRMQGRDAARVSPSPLGRKANEFLREKFGRGTKTERFVEGSSYPWIYLDLKTIAESHADAAAVERELAAWLTKQPGVLAAYGKTDLLDPAKANLPFTESLRRSYYADRCGDVAIVLKPLYLMTSTLTGTNHGTPHDYDVHVPLLVFGPGVRPGVRSDAVTPQAAAAIEAKALGISPPAKAEVKAPEGLFVGQ